jgi:tetratricopeptide (TPR) repeat protein
MMGLYNSGLGYVLEGSVSQGIALLEEGLDMAAGLRYRALRTEAYYGLAQGYLAQGELGRATAVCDEALWFSSATGERKLTPEFHRLMADISLRRGTRHLADARRHLQAAIKICAETGMSLFACRSQLLLAKVYREEKDFAGARIAVTRARELLPARAPEGWLRDAEEELSLIHGHLMS